MAGQREHAPREPRWLKCLNKPIVIILKWNWRRKRIGKKKAVRLYHNLLRTEHEEVKKKSGQKWTSSASAAMRCHLPCVLGNLLLTNFTFIPNRMRSQQDKVYYVRIVTKWHRCEWTYLMGSTNKHIIQSLKTPRPEVIASIERASTACIHLSSSHMNMFRFCFSIYLSLSLSSKLVSHSISTCAAVLLSPLSLSVFRVICHVPALASGFFLLPFIKPLLVASDATNYGAGVWMLVPLASNTIYIIHVIRDTTLWLRGALRLPKQFSSLFFSIIINP